MELRSSLNSCICFPVMVAWHHYILDTSRHPTTINSSWSKQKPQSGNKQGLFINNLLYITFGSFFRNDNPIVWCINLSICDILSTLFAGRRVRGPDGDTAPAEDNGEAAAQDPFAPSFNVFPHQHHSSLSSSLPSPLFPSSSHQQPKPNRIPV